MTADELRAAYPEWVLTPTDGGWVAAWQTPIRRVRLVAGGSLDDVAKVMEAQRRAFAGFLPNSTV